MGNIKNWTNESSYPAVDVTVIIIILIYIFVKKTFWDAQFNEIMKSLTTMIVTMIVLPHFLSHPSCPSLKRSCECVIMLNH